MPKASPFHARTEALCQSFQWRDWSGFHAVSRFEHCHEPEYLAYRNSAGMLDVTPLFKYRIRGADAEAFLDRLVTRNMRRCKVGQVVYTCWCDSRGKVIDDGTISRFSQDDFRLTAAHPCLRWFELCALGYDVEIVDETDDYGALALQGPTSRAIIADVLTGADIEKVRFFRLCQGQIGKAEVTITRTGYTGDLGYEIWVKNADALEVWDALSEAGRAHGLRPAGLVALDIARVEAGFVMVDVDYTSSRIALTDDQRSTPAELGLGWTVSFKKGDFIGREVLEREKAEGGPKIVVTGFQVDYDELRAAWETKGLPVNLPMETWRATVPLYHAGQQVGYASSGVWSPVLKKYIGLCTIDSALAEPGTPVQMETMVLFDRRRVSARTCALPFYDPPQKRA